MRLLSEKARRFDLEKLNTSKVDNILAHVKDPERTIVQVSHELSKNDIAELKEKAPGIRVLRVDTKDFKKMDKVTKICLSVGIIAILILTYAI